MSKCAFASQVLQELANAAAMLGGKVELTLHHIGEGTTSDNFVSMYGADDVLGDKAQLCAQDLAEHSGFLTFLSCHSQDAEQVASSWSRCALAAGIDVQAMRACIDGTRGDTLLSQSFAASNREKIAASPTIRIGGKIYDGPRWAEDYADAICAASSVKIAECKSVKRPEPLPITVIADRRCKDRVCDPEEFLKAAPHIFRGAALRVLDWQDPEARMLFEQSGQQHLPVALFGKEVTSAPLNHDSLKKVGLVSTRDGQGFALSLGNTWDPKRSI